MSAQLPHHPSLENLKKQAKSLHKAHRSGDSKAADRIKTHLPRLTDASNEEILQSDFSLQEAQLIVAREYGFPSWPKLTEAISQTEGSPITTEPQTDQPEEIPSSLPQFTDQAKRVIGLALDESVRLSHNYIGTEHLLLGILADGEGTAIEILTHLGISLNTLKQSIEDYTSSHGDAPKTADRPFTPRTRQILGMASEAARERKEAQAGVE